ncbi:D-alanyl-D-alanine carboxypeptidase family protein [Streptomyces sp. NPDC016309]|uniref:D-alanyl-D-alanine carboxypeptidase family protein n=1 Tax=Streptomyces sp. NPDC016309 TaxID=3364965 RepID=UPI0036F7D54F
MAGESPDKSEQQKSPGETASNDRDPRLAVRGGTGPAEGDAGRSVDQPTAVFRAVPTDATAAADADADADADVDGGAETEADGDADDAGKRADEDVATGDAGDAGKGADEDVATGDAGDAGEAGDAGKGADGDARLRDAVAAWVTKENRPSTTRADEPGGNAPSPEPEAEAETEAAADAPAPEAAEPEPGADEPAAEADAPTTEADQPEPEPEPEADEPAPKGDQPPVDQPTAIFRAVPRKPVDQPTTALKAVTPDAKQGTSGPAAESPAERTSKFVPLRGDDVRPAARKPEPKAPSQAAPAAPAAPATPAAPAKGAAPAGSAEPPRTGAPAKAAAPAAQAPASLTEAERTKQQPLPPRPPLDMLAELTNTPPPPETPVRTAVRRVKIWTPLVLLLLIVFAIVQFVRPLPAPTLKMTATSSFTFEGGKPSLPWPGEGQGYMSATGLGTVDSFGEQKPVPIGSVAKAMTAYVILKEHPLKKGSKGEMIEIDALAEKEGGYDAQNESTLNTVKAGEKISEYDALAAIMIPSANNIARLLARWDAGSEAAFVKKMNDTAKELGMKNTTYTDPSGLNHTTVSSAEDQVKLGEKLVEIPSLVEITAMPWWTDPSGKKWRNYNDLVPYDGALGIKTGSTTKAGGNLLFAAHKKVGDTDQLIVGAVLAQYKTPILGSAIAASKEAMLATQDLLADRAVVKKGDVVGYVDDGLGGSTPVIATKDVKVVGWSGLTVKLELGNDGRPLPHSAPAGTQVGVLTVGEGASQVRVPVALKSALSEPGLGDKLTRIG